MTHNTDALPPLPFHFTQLIDGTLVYTAAQVREAQRAALAAQQGAQVPQLPENATEPMQKAMQRAVLMRKSMNDVWRAALSELSASPQAPAQPERDDGMPASKTERELRRMLCAAYAGSAAYMDDGEASDGREFPAIDFMRMTPEAIREAMAARGLAQAKRELASAPAAQAEQEPVGYTAQPITWADKEHHHSEQVLKITRSPQPQYGFVYPIHASTQRAVEPLTDEQIDGLRGLDTASRVRFYEHDFYVLSNFSAFTLIWKGIRFDTSEAAYHWEKFTGDSGSVQLTRHFIQTAPSAHEAFKIAERNKEHRRPDWDEVKVGIMLDILREKAKQHEYVRRKLLATGDRELVEDSWRDDFWGWGPNRDGRNMLGTLWMQVRAELREQDQ